MSNTESRIELLERQYRTLAQRLAQFESTSQLHSDTLDAHNRTFKEQHKALVKITMMLEDANLPQMGTDTHHSRNRKSATSNFRCNTCRCTKNIGY